MNRRVIFFLLTLLGSMALLGLRLYTPALFLMSAGLTIHWVFRWRGAALGLVPYGVLLYWLTGDWVTVVVSLATIAAVSATISYFLLTHRSFSYMLVGAAVMLLLSDMAILKILSGRSGTAIPDMLVNIPFEGLVPTLENTLAALNITDTARIFSAMDAIRQTMVALLPTFLIISALVSSYIIIAITRALLLRIGLRYDYLPYFYDLRCNRLLVYVALLTFGLKLLLPGSYLGYVAFNMSVITGFVLVSCGLSVVDFHLKVHKVPGVLRGVIYVIVMLIFSPGGMLTFFLNPIFVLGALGCLDAFRNLRIERAGD